MCKACVQALQDTFPEVPDEEMGDFLMNVTAFPCCDHETVAKQLKELRAKTSNYKACYGIVDREMDEIYQAREDWERSG
jgi:hypothetical protein